MSDHPQVTVKLSEVTAQATALVPSTNIIFPNMACVPFILFEYIKGNSPAESRWEYLGTDGVLYVVYNQ